MVLGTSKPSPLLSVRKYAHQKLKGVLELSNGKLGIELPLPNDYGKCVVMETQFGGNGVIRFFLKGGIYSKFKFLIVLHVLGGIY